MTTEVIQSYPVIRPLRGLKFYFTMMKRDISSVIERDPAARSPLEVFLVYSGLHAIWVHRISHWLWMHKVRFFARWLSQIGRGLTGIEIHPGATLAPGIFIDHGMGVVIGETAEIGVDVTLYHGVTLGGTSLEKGKRHPTIGDRVVIGAGAKVLGAITIGDDSRIGANAVVVKSVPPNSVVIGVPGQVVKRSQLHHAGDAPDLNHTTLPDIVGVTLKELLERVDLIENRVVGIKSREVYEAPAATILLAAHRALEEMTLSRDVARQKAYLSQVFSDIIYSGRWFSDLREALAAFIGVTQKYVTGTLRVRLYKGQCTVTGRRSPCSLYDKSLATYGAGDAFEHEAAKGFLGIYKLDLKAQGLRRKRCSARASREPRG